MCRLFDAGRRLWASGRVKGVSVGECRVWSGVECVVCT